MTLQRRLMLLLLLSAPLVWGAGLLYGLDRARHEINELFDTQQIRLARQVLSTLPRASFEVTDLAPLVTEPAPSSDSVGEAELEDMGIAVWNREGQLLLVDREGGLLPMPRGEAGFSDMTLGGEAWRVYHAPANSGEWQVSVGQKQEERDELVWNLLASQLVPWVLTLPVLLLVMAGAVRQALKPVRSLTHEIEHRGAGDLHPLSTPDVPTDLQPLLLAMNTLLARIADSNARERRFIADAAHELRTPLAALQAQWDAQRLNAAGEAGKATRAAQTAPAGEPGVADRLTSARAPQDKIGQGLGRMSRLVSQLLSLSRLDQGAAPAMRDIAWPRLVEGLFSDLLPLAQKAGVDMECTWPPDDSPALPLKGDDDLIAAMLRNLLDNAIRHSAPGQTVTLRLLSDAIEVIDDGPGVDDEHLARLGDRFFRAPGQEAPGSGLGLSIVGRIAALHGLRVSWANRDGAPAAHRGFMVRLIRA